jgi:NTP pyrophosphatase (non-canonical NTP hydrolase)
MSNTPQALTIRAFQKFIHDKYYATDSVRGTPATFMWFIEEVGELSTAMANNAPGKNATPEQRANLDEEFADVFAWLCTLANINGVDLERALEKYTVKGVDGVKS